MLIGNDSQDFLKLECKKQATRLKLLPFYIVSFLILFLALKDAIEANKMVSIECNKTENECVFKENDYIFGKKQIITPFDTLGDAYLRSAGDPKGIRNYDLIFPSSHGDIKLYDYVPMKSYLELIGIEFNMQKNSSDINTISVNPPFNFQLTYTTIMVIVLFFVILWVVLELA